MQRPSRLPFHTAANCLIILLILSSCYLSPDDDSVSGVVLSQTGPIADAVVRIQTTDTFISTNPEGIFILNGLEPDSEFTLTAWKSGYFIAGIENIKPGMEDLEIHLETHAETDNPSYAWLPSLYHPGEGENQGCAECHSRAGTDIAFNLPADEWKMDSHSQSALNPRFLSMYSGTDVLGNQSPLTRYDYAQDYGTFPLPPDPNQPYYGPGYKLDFPETNGNCAACHTPATSLNNPYQVDPAEVTGVGSEGVPCDFCHKIWGINLNPAGMPNDNMPGILSYEFRRPPEGHQLFIGPLDDVAPGEDTYSPLQEQSQFCAACHYGTFWDTVIYNSYGEWLESPYNDPETGKQCQDCHMPPTGVSHFALPEAGGLARNPDTIFSHYMPGAANEELLQNSVTMSVEVEPRDDEITVSVNITNDQAGHHVPTDSPLRHLILVIDSIDSDGNRMIQLDGPVTPDWVGMGDPSLGYYAGLPGKTYAKVLMERWTQTVPSGSYWNPTKIVIDNRLAAFETDISQYSFQNPENRSAVIKVTLIYRRAFLQLAEQKGWIIPDIIMEEVQIKYP